VAAPKMFPVAWVEGVEASVGKPLCNGQMANPMSSEYGT